MQYLVQGIKWILILLIVLFSIATFMGKSYLQTGVLWLLVLTLAYWPPYFSKEWGRRVSLGLRTGVGALLFAVGFFAFPPAPKTSIYTSTEMEDKLMRIYDRQVAGWPAHTEDLFVETPYGKVHVLACGAPENPPIMLLHAASMGAHSWKENLPPLLSHFRIYAIDNIGEGNKSQLHDALAFPQNSQEIADLYALIADSLGIDRSAVFGSSNGGFITMSYAWHYPERVSALALFGPMGLTQLSGRSILMLSLASMYPFQFVRDYVARWALGRAPTVRESYGDWFNCIMEATIPSVAQPMPMTSEQKQQMQMPVLLFLGTRDPIVGDAQIAARTARDFPNIQIETLASGHLVSVEHAAHVNARIREFLALP